MVVLYNPRSTTPGKQPLPLSLMALAAVLEGREPWALVDENVTADPVPAIVNAFASIPAGEPRVLAVTVMPGPQLTHAVAACRAIRARMPEVAIVWGGYFPTTHAKTVIRSPLVDFAIRSQGEQPLLQLLRALRTGGALGDVANLSWKAADDRVMHNPEQPLTPLDALPDLPYARVPMEDYIHSDYLGSRTVAHVSSFGCPFACSFCAVVAMSNRQWLAQSPSRIERIARHLVARYRVDAVQMHDMDFFISEARTAECAERLAPLHIRWWALGRIDTLMRYSDATWLAMKRSGLKMVFSGAESGSDAKLAAMNKGGSASARLAIELARRMREHGIVPEFSFVLGTPPDPMADLEETFEYIREIKRANPATEIILYTYTPVPAKEGLYADATRLGFAFPETLEEWASDEWRQHALRRGRRIPWVNESIRQRVRDFERVLNAYYPTVTDRRLTKTRRAVLRAASAWRYRLKVYSAPYELRALHHFIHYQRPETTGF